MNIKVETTVTIKELINILLDCPMNEEVLLEKNGDDFYCAFVGSSAEEEHPEIEIVSRDVKSHNNPSKKEKRNSYSTLQQRRDYYNRTYGATAFKYGKRKWTQEEDNLIESYNEDRDLVLSSEMHRSLAAIHTKRHRLKKLRNN